MKKLNVKNEKGAVTLLVLVSILFFVMVLLSLYMLVSNKAQSQIEMTRETRRIYEKETPEDAYNSFFGDNIIPIYTAEHFIDIGSNKNIPVNEEGSKYYTFSPSSTYVLMNDLEFANDGIFTLNLEGEGRLEGNGREVKIRDSSKAEEVYYYYNASNNYKTAIVGDIVYDGLILYYDGINNTGNGHSNAATSWRDISGSDNDILNVNTANWLENGLQFNNNILTSKNVINAFGKNITMEIVLLNKQRKYVMIGFEGGTQLKLRVAGDIVYWNCWPIILQPYSAEEVLNAITSYGYVNDYTNSSARQFINNVKKAATVSDMTQVSGNYIIGGAAETFVGDIYAIRVYNRALSDREIEQNHNIDKIRYGF